MNNVTALALAVALAAAGCEVLGEPQRQGVTVNGAIYTDFKVDATCAEQTAPPELTGVVLTFVNEDGEVLGMARTGQAVGRDLPQGEGMDAWTAFGCRFAAPYAAELPAAAAYEVRFTPVPADAASAFTGVEDLQPQQISLTDLQANGFRWDFEAGASYAVP